MEKEKLMKIVMKYLFNYDNSLNIKSRMNIQFLKFQQFLICE